MMMYNNTQHHSASFSPPLSNNRVSHRPSPLPLLWVVQTAAKPTKQRKGSVRHNPPTAPQIINSTTTTYRTTPTTLTTSRVQVPPPPLDRGEEASEARPCPCASPAAIADAGCRHNRRAGWVQNVVRGPVHRVKAAVAAEASAGRLGRRAKDVVVGARGVGEARRLPRPHRVPVCRLGPGRRTTGVVRPPAAPLPVALALRTLLRQLGLGQTRVGQNIAARDVLGSRGGENS